MYCTIYMYSKQSLCILKFVTLVIIFVNISGINPKNFIASKKSGYCQAGHMCNKKEEQQKFSKLR